MGKDNDYRVGYGKPPSEHQFKKGKSGNPCGRPRKRPRWAPNEPLDFNRSFVAALQSKLTIVENGKKKQITMMDAINKQLVTRAVQGDKTAMREVLSAVRPLREELFLDRRTELHEEWKAWARRESKREGAMRMLEIYGKYATDDDRVPRGNVSQRTRSSAVAEQDKHSRADNGQSPGPQLPSLNDQLLEEFGKYEIKSTDDDWEPRGNTGSRTPSSAVADQDKHSRADNGYESPSSRGFDDGRR